ncbi:rhodopsin-like isoform X2 [Vespa mandarinia]|uniref:rhodopsin-like isoform X2 n=1 Tax=Vespa mandarinia TaxID=7446 RepID=UPI00161878C9|nr:rhodopsin-like isoform X2 [Vespa mandarinia]
MSLYHREADHINVTVNEEISPIIYVGASIVLGIIGFFGFTLNLIVAFIIVKDAQSLWTPVNVILFNMVVGDFIVAALGNPLAMISAINGGWYAWFMSTLGFASIGNLTVMAVERWLLITRPMKALSIRHAMFLAFAVWIYALSLSLPPLFGWGSYGPEAGNVSCSVSWEVHDSATNSDSYIGFLFILGLVLPVVVIVTSYFAIVITTIRVKRKAGKKDYTRDLSAFIFRFFFFFRTCAGTRGRREAKVTKMVALMISTFLIAWSPYAALALAAQYFNVKPSPSVAVLPALLAKSSICYNPIIYAGLNAQFPRSLKKILGIRDIETGTNGSQQTALTTINKQ